MTVVTQMCSPESESQDKTVTHWIIDDDIQQKIRYALKLIRVLWH